MKCKKCGYEWQTYGESPTCPGCATFCALTQSEKQTLWEEAHEAEKLKDAAHRTACYFKLAEQGDERAQYAYAECLRQGIGIAQNLEQAAIWYKASARRMYPAAAYRLALCLRSDRRFGDAARQVFFWLRVAAEFGEVNAVYDLSKSYEKGEGAAPSHRHALFWLTRAALAGHDDAIVELAKMYATGDGVERRPGVARGLMQTVASPSFRLRRFMHRLGRGEMEDVPEIVLPERESERLSLGMQAEENGEYAIAAHIYFFAAKGGNTEACYRIGLCYEAGNGVPKSAEEARRRYAIAAKAGHVGALLRLGILAEAAADVKEALSCYTRVADMGNMEGAYRLGEMYSAGKILHADLPEALRFYERAARGGHAEAKTRLEKMREAATVVYEKAMLAASRGDVDAARSAFTLAAEMGHAGAAYAVGVATEEEAGESREGRRRAAAYYRIAAEGGNLGGIYRLGLCYSRGFGIARDTRVASRLLSVAAKQNFADASRELEAIRLRKHKRTAERFYAISSVLYRKGDVMEAIKFRNIAAKLGSARAMYVLGCHFEFGDGLPADRAKASAWYTRASRAGFDASRGDLKGGFLRERKMLLMKNKRG